MWIGTSPAPHPLFPMQSMPAGIAWIRGQLERGDEGGGYDHWQYVFALSKRGRLAAVTAIFGTTSHFELTRSRAAEDYVWKEDTSLGERFELGTRPIGVNSKPDWDAIWELAKSGDLGDIPSGIRVRSYFALRAIASDHGKPVSMVRTVRVFWGATGTGKSRRAWDEAGEDAYSKCPRTKFWDGYQSQPSVVIDEFRGGIDVSHLLRWFDRYPVRVEIKGSTRPFNAGEIWITSNLPPSDWYPDIDHVTYAALLRRFTLVEELT